MYPYRLKGRSVSLEAWRNLLDEWFMEKAESCICQICTKNGQEIMGTNCAREILVIFKKKKITLQCSSVLEEAAWKHCATFIFGDIQGELGKSTIWVLSEQK